MALSCERVAEPDLDASEQLVVRTFRREEAESLLDSGRLADGFTALTLLYYLRRRASGPHDSAPPPPDEYRAPDPWHPAHPDWVHPHRRVVP